MSEQQYSLDDLWHEKEYRRCAALNAQTPNEELDGFLHFCENYVHIRHPEFGKILFSLFEAQIEAVQCWLSTRYSLVLKARQIGFSTIVAIFALWHAAFHPDRPILLLSRTEREAIKLLQKAKYALQFMPEWLKFRLGPVTVTQTKMEFANGSYIESLPSASDPARGESAYLIVVDELAFLPNSEEAWSAIEPVADVGGRVIMLSTANGEGNLFHRLWVESIAGANRFTSLFFSWSANGRDEDWYEAKKRDLPEWQLAQEYPDNPDDAFLKSGRPVFSLEQLRSLKTVVPTRGRLETDLRFYEDGGPLRVWAFPDPAGKYVIGADPSQGLEHGDFASVHVINARDHHVVAKWHGHIDPDLLATEVLIPLGRWYGNALLGVESNNHGLTTLKFLAKERYHPIYMDRAVRTKKSRASEALGYRTTQVTKPLMIDELQAALRGPMLLEDEETIGELRTFTRDERGRMSGSPYDDQTISLAIANQMLKHVFLPEYEPENQGPLPGTFEYMEQKLYGSTFEELTKGVRSKSKPARPLIGANFVRER